MRNRRDRETIDGHVELVRAVWGPHFIAPPDPPTSEMRKAVDTLVTDALKPTYKCRPEKDRAMRVIRARYGLDNGQWRTLASVAALEGATRERVRQVEAMALRRLRHSSHREALQRAGWLYDSPRDAEEGLAPS